MNSDTTININPSQLENFSEVWKELLKQKVRIVYEISKFKKYNFYSLLEEVLPEALEHKTIWQDNYIEAVPPTIPKKDSNSLSKLNNNCDANIKLKIVPKVNKPQKKFKFKIRS